MSPEVIVEKFKLNPDGFVNWLCYRLGFKQIGQGGFSTVYSKDGFDYVVKVGGGMYSIPKGEHYLLPTYVVNSDGGLMIQPKCDEVYTGDFSAECPTHAYWIDIQKSLSKKCKGWRDTHCGNVGIYKGKPVIIDW